MEVVKKVYLIRYGAWGDHMHMSNVISAFKRRGYYVGMEYNWKGAQLMTHNPHIDAHYPFDPWLDPEILKKPMSWLLEQQRSRNKSYDLVVDFSHSLETGMIAAEDMEEYYYPNYLKNRKYGRICYYDQSMHWAGIMDEDGKSGEVYFTSAEHETIKKKLAPYKDRYKILWCLSGSMWQKAIYPWSKDVCDEFLRQHPDAVIWTTGGPECVKYQWNHDRVINVSGSIPFRQAALMTRYMNLVVTPETGLGIVAGSYSTPKIMLLTAASIRNIAGNDKNDFSMQSDAHCSPCHRAIYNTRNCLKEAKTGLPICVFFDKERVLARMEYVYNLRHPQNWEPGKLYKDAFGNEVYQ